MHNVATPNEVPIRGTLLTYFSAVVRRRARCRPIRASVIQKKIDPEYSPDLKAFLVQPAKVEITIDDHGVPFSLKSSTGLPDSVVQALSMWRFHPARNDGRAVASSASFIVPLKRPIEGSGRMTRYSHPSSEDSDALAAGRELDAAKVLQLQEGLKQNPDDRKTRVMLLGIRKARPEKMPSWCGSNNSCGC